MTARAARDRAKPARETLLRLRAVEGLTLAALALRFGCSEQTVWAWCRGYGIRGRPVTRPQPVEATERGSGGGDDEDGSRATRQPVDGARPQMRIVGSDPREMVERALAAGWRPTRGETRHAARQWSGRPLCRGVGI